MFDVRNSIQEVRRNDNNHLNHPKSAPIKPDPDASAGPLNYGGHIYSMFQGDEATKQKKMQQKAYFQELTRQVQEKKVEVHPGANFPNDKSLLYSGNFAGEIAKMPFVSMEDDKKYPRYQKKYEIENHVGINVNTSQVFGGVLQRDEAFLLKLKKEEQQREMQLVLSRQIQEKNRKREEEQAWKRKVEISQVEWSKERENEEVPIGSPRKNLESTMSPMLNPENSLNSKTLPTFNQKEEENDGKMESLSEVVQKLLEEKAQLALRVQEQEKKITDLHLKQFETEPAKPESAKRIERTEKPKSRPPKSRIQSAQEVKIKAQHEQERAKIAQIEEKLENARKKRIEQTKTKVITKPRRISDLQVRSDSRETFTKGVRIKSAASPVQALHFLSEESPKIIGKAGLDRDNLDSAGKSSFIYPDSNGDYVMCDEIDKFVTNYERREQPMASFKSPYKGTPIENDARFTFTSMTGSARRETKPLVANKQGFPSDIFRLP